MIRLTMFDIKGGFDKHVVGDFESLQVTGEWVRDPDGNEILHYFAPDETWFDMKTGNGWYDWTIETVEGHTYGTDYGAYRGELELPEGLLDPQV